MEIIDLRKAPQYIPTIARWHFDEWGYLNPGKTLEYRIQRMQRYLGEAVTPTMLIAVEGDEVLGTAALVEADMDSHPELTPWLASVYIREDQRGRGLGKQLVKAVMALAGDLKIPELFLFTPDQAGFYAKLGWKPVSEETYHDKSVTIMRLDYQESI